jgi:hypothetical protein
MRWAVTLTFAAFIAILVVAWIAAERAHPKMIDVDPATMKVDLVHK